MRLYGRIPPISLPKEVFLKRLFILSMGVSSGLENVSSEVLARSNRGAILSCVLIILTVR